MSLSLASSHAGRRLRRVWIPLGLLTAAGLALAGVALYRLVNPAVSIEAQTAGCDLQAGPCSFDLADGGRVTLELSPRPLKPMSPLQVRASLQGVNPDRVELDVSGVDMYMGYNRPRLEVDAEGDFHGRLILPVCSSRIMSWNARLLISLGEELIAAPFRFSTDAS